MTTADELLPASAASMSALPDSDSLIEYDRHGESVSPKLGNEGIIQIDSHSRKQPQASSMACSLFLSIYLYSPDFEF